MLDDRPPTGQPEDQALAPLEKRRVGRTDLHVTSLGLGTATMGGSRIALTNEERVKLVDVAWNAGVRYVDTAPFYGVGAAERATGDALRDKLRDEWVLSTKVGVCCGHAAAAAVPLTATLAPLPFEVNRLFVRHHALGGGQLSAAGPRSTSCSCTDIGVYQHGAEANAAHMKVLRESGYRALEELKRSGVISAFGLGVNEKEVLIDVLGWGEWDARTLHAAQAARRSAADVRHARHVDQVAV